MEDRLARLEARLEELARTVQGVEARLARLESAPASGRRVTGAGGETSPGADVVEVTLDHSAFARVLGLIGRSCLVLGGAFLIRALTDSHALPGGAGVAVGLAYAVGWVLVADRAGGRGERLSAVFHGIVAAGIAYPLLWETTVHYGILTPPLAAVATAALTGLCILVARRRDLRPLAWAGTLGALAASLALILATHTLVEFTAVLILTGAATVWLGYDRHWHALRWPAAFVADAVALQATLIASRAGGPQPPWGTVSRAGVAALALVLLVVYLGAFAARILRRHRDVTVFEVLQAAFALLVGFGGATRVAEAAAWPRWPIGAGALAVGAACYAVAFAFVERRAGAGRSFLYFSFLALVLVLVGGLLAAGGGWVAVFWSVVGLAASLPAARFDRLTLRVHAATYVLAAALACGLFGWARDALFAGVASSWHPFPPLGAFVLALALPSYLLLAPGGKGVRRWFEHLPALGVAVVGVVALLSLGVVAARPLFSGGTPGADAGVLAATRTGVLALATLGCAAASRRVRFTELAWLVYPMLGLGGAKLLVEDLLHGRAATLFPALAVYGLVLILAPRLLRRPRAPTG
jgi:hypothetical protein